ncbi:endonuclease/exonuclease/phosphatase family protein [Hazenella sp. IB182353]|uniref:endonuclease/exonuclease/phosphatase family protein n=1 Tax=Polycladospora coralii TaxID=2771432 RepID=UPI001746882C|nr:endonuclease/exonuclease/phosphatase family protein [Polycladospora coralii]MBS7529632.1 endonuclease/exonuclease/phosphatase family protein [Polycladospora coralii]
MVNKILKALAILASVLLLGFGGFLGYVTLTDYKPQPIEKVAVQGTALEKLATSTPFSVTTFNIGYAGLDKDQDFFLDGGTQSHSLSEEKTLENVAGITKAIKDANASFYFLQEVDRKASRSFHVNEYDYIQKQLPNYQHVFAQNYRVPWVPVPVFDPMGSVDGGLVTFSKYEMGESTRYALPGQEAWPRQQMELDRCLLETKVPLENGKTLYLVHVHLSAYDEGGFIRKQQLTFLKAYLQEREQAGDYVIVGGDWNHLLPGTDPKRFAAQEVWPDWLQTFPTNFLPEGYTWAADPNVPTSRTLSVAYREGYNFLSVIDGFLVSNNVEIQKVSGHDLGFTYSDHNPVTAEFKLK